MPVTVGTYEDGKLNFYLESVAYLTGTWCDALHLWRDNTNMCGFLCFKFSKSGQICCFH